MLDATATGRIAPAAPPAGRAEDPLLLVYTSGTTGRPKGAVLTQRALLSTRERAAHHALTAADQVLTVLPLFHVGGLNIQTMPALLAGARSLLHAALRPRRHLRRDRRRPADPDPAGAGDDAGAGRPPALGRGRPLLPARRRHRLVRGAGAADRRLPRARRAGAAGLRRDRDRPDRHRPDTARRRWRRPAPSAGRRCTARRVVEARGRCAPGTRARSQVRGPNVMRGYWSAPEATATALADGWFATGDVGRCDAEGRFWFTDRLKHMIISGGENIYPAEVERVLAHCARRRRMAPSCGRPDPRWGEVPVAVVVPGPGFDARRCCGTSRAGSPASSSRARWWRWRRCRGRRWGRCISLL